MTSIPNFEPRYRIKDSDMPDEMQHFAASTAAFGVDNQMPSQEMSAHIKTLMNEKFGGTWQCTAGNSFAHSVSYVQGTYMFLYVGELAVLIYKSPGEF